jgi:hypothetical protein
MTLPGDGSIDQPILIAAIAGIELFGIIIQTDQVGDNLAQGSRVVGNL